MIYDIQEKECTNKCSDITRHVINAVIFIVCSLIFCGSMIRFRSTAIIETEMKDIVMNTTFSSSNSGTKHVYEIAIFPYCSCELIEHLLEYLLLTIQYSLNLSCIHGRSFIISPLNTFLAENTFIVITHR